jgi:predicted RNA-binding Zn-ribbon protein involved in translation (DUF1610 family)
MERPEEFCPHCGADIIGDEIPVEIRHHYKPPYYWLRKIGITDLELDRITYWQCPDCNHIWENKKRPYPLNSPGFT